jgi:hypothetical protein
MKFASREEALRYKRTHAEHIELALQFACSLESVEYGEVWLNQHTPSYVAGFNSEDDIVVSIPLSKES